MLNITKNVGLIQHKHVQISAINILLI